jgi:prefoldin subunit 5
VVHKFEVRLEEKMRKIAVVLVLVLGLLLAACGARATSIPEESKGAIAPLPAMEAPRTSADMLAAGSAPASAPAAPAGQMVEQPSNQPPTTTDSGEQLIVKNANLSMIVPNSAQAMQQITDLAKVKKGYVVSSNLFKSTTGDGQTYTNANITIRVPVEKLEETLASIRGLVKDPTVDITSESVTGEDVTATVVDLESRLRNYQKVVVKLNQMLDEATKTEDALNVFNQLVYYQEQIEVLQGQIKYYRETAAMSAIALNLTEQPPVVPVTIGGWHPIGVARDAIQALIHFLQWLMNALIWVGLCILPVLLLIWLPLYLIWRSMKHRGWVWKGWRPVKVKPAPETIAQK